MKSGSTSKLLTDHFRFPEEIASPLPFSVRSAACKWSRIHLEPAVAERIRSSESNETDSIAGKGIGGEQESLDAATVVDHVRLERYVTNSGTNCRPSKAKKAVRNIYYTVRPLMPVAVRRQFQKFYFRGWDKMAFPKWPVDRTVEDILESVLASEMKLREVRKLPFIWFWPDGLDSAAILTHDVETAAGAGFCGQLMDLNDSFGIKSSFQIVPEDRYSLPPTFLEKIRKRGFEVNVHDLNHDGHLFSDRAEFLRRVEQINSYGQQWGALGFRSVVLYRNVDWYDALDFSYDMSIPSVAHLDPQRGGCCTVFPYFIGKLLELPVTTIQDYSLFHILNDYSIRLWREQISLIREMHGLANIIVHPDYIIEKRARRVYAELLQYLAELRNESAIWFALPREVVAWWRMRHEMKLTNVRGTWRVVGNGGQRARIAYAVLVDDKISYEIDR